MVNGEVMAMNTQAALHIIGQIEALIDSEESSARISGKGTFWERDKNIIHSIRSSLASNESEQIRWAFDQIRNFSQGFGSYCQKLRHIDHLLDKLYSEFVHLMSTGNQT